MTEHERLKRHEPIRAKHVVAILATVLFCIAGIEGGARFAFARLSRIERRIATDHASVLRMPRTQSVRSILLVGDSLLLEDIDMKLLVRAFPDVHLQRFPIEQTAYLDWLYGLRRIFSDGVRPSTVILCIGPNSFISNETRGDYGAYYLFQTGDIPAVAKAAKYDLTTESGLFFARYSRFYAGRSGLRNFALNRLDPSYGDLLHRLLTRGASPVPRNEVLRICEPRFQELQRLCAEHHANFVYVVPPGFGFHDDAMAEAGSRAGASVLVPVHNDAWKLEKYRDGFHLSEMGAREFTAILSPSLNTLLRSFEAAQ